MTASEFAAGLYPKVTKAVPSTVVYEGSSILVARILSSIAWIFGPRVMDLALGGISGLNDLAKFIKENKEKAV